VLISKPSRSNQTMPLPGADLWDGQPRELAAAGLGGLGAASHLAVDGMAHGLQRASPAITLSR
jgi:hypothetical protein